MLHSSPPHPELQPGLGHRPKNESVSPEWERSVNKEELVGAIPRTRSFKTRPLSVSHPLERTGPSPLPEPSFHMAVREPWTITQGWNVPTHLTGEKLRLETLTGLAHGSQGQIGP